MSNEFEVGTHIDLTHLNAKVAAHRPKVTRPSFMAVALDKGNTRFAFKVARSIPVVYI